MQAWAMARTHIAARSSTDKASPSQDFWLSHDSNYQPQDPCPCGQSHQCHEREHTAQSRAKPRFVLHSL